MSDPDPGVPPGRFLGPLPFELYAVALHGRLALGEDRDHVEGRTGPQSREQRLHRTHAERDLLPVYDDLVPGPVLAHVPRATQMSDSHSRVRHLATLHSTLWEDRAAEAPYLLIAYSTRPAASAPSAASRLARGCWVSSSTHRMVAAAGIVKPSGRRKGRSASGSRRRKTTTERQTIRYW